MGSQSSVLAVSCSELDVCVVTGLRTGRPEFDSRRVPPNLLSSGYRLFLSLRVRRPWSETGHLPPSSAELSMRGAVPPFLLTPSWRSA